MRAAKPTSRTRDVRRPVNRTDSRRPSFEAPSLFDLAPAKEQAGTFQCTVYQLDRVPGTAEGMRTALGYSYLANHDFPVLECRVGQAPALLVHGSVPCERAEWCDVLATMTGDMPTVGYRNAGAALLVAVDDRVYALTFGTLGRHMVDLDRVNPGFGIGFAVRALDPDLIKQVRRRVFSLSGRVDRNFVPGGQHIRQYGIDRCGEMVGQISGRTSNPRLTACRSRNKPTPIEGSDSLRISLGTDPADLLADLREIDRVCRQEPPDPDLEFITQIRPLRAGDHRLAGLERRVDEQLAMAAPPDLGLSVPDNVVADLDWIRSYRVSVPQSGRLPYRTERLDLSDLLAYTRRLPDGQRWPALRGGRIATYADQAGRDAQGTTYAARWITAQFNDGASQFILQEGHWYEIGDQHLAFLHDEVTQLLKRPASVTLPPWTSNFKDEDAYNRHVAKPGSGFVLLDKHQIRTPQHSRGPGFEACDVLGPNQELIHVKRAAKSSPLSHLFAQGEISVQALRYEADARQRLVDLVRAKEPDYPIDLDFRPRKVVYAIALGSGKPLTATSLFTFAQVALYRAARSLRLDEVEVEVLGIPVR